MEITSKEDDKYEKQEFDDQNEFNVDNSIISRTDGGVERQEDKRQEIRESSDPGGDLSSKGKTDGGSKREDANYLLGGRLALNKPKPKKEYEGQGRVVIKIYVNRTGSVIRAQTGEKVPRGVATTINSPCENAALRTTWQADADAPSVQVGYIIYNFKIKSNKYSQHKHNEIALQDEAELESMKTNETEYLKVIEIEEEVSDEVLNFMVVESVPVWPGCEDETNNDDDKRACFSRQIQRYTAKNFDFLEMARQMGIQGRVYVQFVVEENGSFSNIEVIRGVDPLLDEETVRVVKSMPKVKPAKQRDKPVRMSFTLPVNAKLP